MPVLNRSHWPLRALGAITLLSACNAILDNDPRALDPGQEGPATTGGVHGGPDAGGMTTDPGGAPPRGEDEGGAAGVPSSTGDAGSAGEAGAGSCGPVNGGCTPDETSTKATPCGACMTGTRTQTRTCTSSCTGGPWDEGGACTGVTATCTAGMAQTRSVACPCSGTKTQSRTCSTACSWGGWSDTSSCDLECCSEIVYCDTPNDVAANRGTWCRRTDPDCANAEVDSDCKVDIEEVCGPVVTPLFTEY